MTHRIILDTNVLVAALTSADGASRQIIRQLLMGEAVALVSLPLYEEYKDVLGRQELLQRCPLNREEVDAFFDAFLTTTELVSIFYNWRPNLKDEGDNHVFELAVAAANAPLITFNLRDFSQPQLKFPAMKVLTPAQWLNMNRSA